MLNVRSVARIGCVKSGVALRPPQRGCRAGDPVLATALQNLERLVTPDYKYSAARRPFFAAQ